MAFPNGWVSLQRIEELNKKADSLQSSIQVSDVLQVNVWHAINSQRDPNHF